MNTDEFKVLKDKVDSIQGSLDIIDRDMGKDREDLQQLSIRVGAMEDQLEELRKQIRTLIDKVGDRIAEAVEPVRQEAQDLKETIADKPFIEVAKEKVKKLPWFKRWFWR